MIFCGICNLNKPHVDSDPGGICCSQWQLPSGESCHSAGESPPMVFFTCPKEQTFSILQRAPSNIAFCDADRSLPVLYFAHYLPRFVLQNHLTLVFVSGASFCTRRRKSGLKQSVSTLARTTTGRLCWTASASLPLFSVGTSLKLSYQIVLVSGFIHRGDEKIVYCHRSGHTAEMHVPASATRRRRDASLNAICFSKSLALEFLNEGRDL